MAALPEVRLELAGGGPDEARLRARAAKLANVTVHGSISDIPAFLSRADAVVIPSRWEPWGNVCLEAKAAGRPVIASDVDGLREQVQGCGLLVPPDDPAALVAAIRAFDGERLPRWGAAGRAAGRTAWPDHLHIWRTLFRELV